MPVMMKNLSIFDRSSKAPRLDPSLGTLDAVAAAKVADYLSSGTVLLRSTQRVPDAVAGRSEEIVPISTRTDGEYVWSEAVAYYRQG